MFEDTAGHVQCTGGGGEGQKGMVWLPVVGAGKSDPEAVRMKRMA